MLGLECISLPRGGGHNLFYLGRLQLYLLLKPNQTSKYKKESSLPKTWMLLLFSIFIFEFTKMNRIPKEACFNTSHSGSARYVTTELWICVTSSVTFPVVVWHVTWHSDILSKCHHTFVICKTKNTFYLMSSSDFIFPKISFFLFL